MPSPDKRPSFIRAWFCRVLFQLVWRRVSFFDNLILSACHG